tara:strand:+ start:330 stop:506 length:177 start_codon:yes stop_codon:yes gene_type:complete
MTYAESAAGIQISRKRAIQELEKHGIDSIGRVEFFQELGDHSMYAAEDVLVWLGFSTP